MTSPANRALEKLRDPDRASLATLARMIVEQTTATPLRDIATPRWIAGQIAAALEASTRGDRVRDWVDQRITSERDRWEDRDETLRGYLPDEVDGPLRELLGRPYAPSEEMVFRMIDQPAIRALIRQILSNTVSRFRQSLTKVDEGVLGGLGGRAARRGRGLFGQRMGRVSEVASNLGGVASNLAGAVRDELESSMDGRVKDFVQQASKEQIRAIARYLADPEHADSFAELRLAILDVVIDTPIRELAAETDKLQPEQVVDIVVGAIRSLVSADDFVARTEQRIGQILEDTGDGTLGAWLEDVQLLDVWTETTTELVTARLGAVVETDAFGAWWSDLFTE
jgi:hypothetical protein